MHLISEEDYKNQQAFSLGRKLYKYTPPIIKLGVIPEFVASCVLLKFNDSRFLVTAAHVLKYNDRRLLRIPFNKSILPIVGDHLITSASTIENDKIDLAVFKLDQGAINALTEEGFLFFDMNRINVDPENIGKDNYIIFGHPISRNEVKLSARKLRIEPFNYRTSVSEDRNLYDRLGFSHDTHQILHYRKRKIRDAFSNNIITGPDPVGMSGCGAWCVPDLLLPEESFPTSIIIEYDIKRNAMIGTKIAWVTEIIRKNFEPEMPRSKVIQFSQTSLGQKPSQLKV
jgi:hypothetical protein